MIILLLLPVMVLACNRPVKGKNGVVYKNAMQYNDYIVSRQSIVIRNIMSFGKVARSDADSAYGLLDQYAEETGRLINELKGMPPYGGDSSFRDAAVTCFVFYKRVLEKDYKELLDVRRRTDIDLTTTDSLLNEISDRLGAEEDVIDRKFQKAQERFVKSNNLKLTDNEIQKEIDKYDQ